LLRITRIASLFAAVAARFGKRWRFADDSAASLLEYAIVLGMVSVAAYVALQLMGQNASSVLSTVAGSISE
jgi:NADPH-dependent curcumin reductase CurA